MRKIQRRERDRARGGGGRGRGFWKRAKAPMRSEKKEPSPGTKALFLLLERLSPFCSLFTSAPFFHRRLGTLLVCSRRTRTHSLASLRALEILRSSLSRAPLQLSAPWLRTKRRPTPSSCRATKPLRSTSGLPRWTFIPRLLRNMTRSRRSFPTGLRCVGLRQRGDHSMSKSPLRAGPGILLTVLLGRPKSN